MLEARVGAKAARASAAGQLFREEWDGVIVPQRVTDRDGYFSARRIGRGVALTRVHRAAIWAVFKELNVQLDRRGLRCSEHATQDAADLLEAGKAFQTYGAVVVDEAQDMGPDVMRLIRCLVRPQANDVFIVGDGHQRIYRRRYALSACGIQVRGRSRKLKINYRTTEETRRFATAILQGQAVDDLDGGVDTSGDYRSLMHGQAPIVQGFSSQPEELDWIAQEIGRLRGQGIALQDFCIAARTNALVDRYFSGLKERGLPCVRLSRKSADNRSREGVRVATMHRVKGLAFRYVMLVGANEGVLPLRQALESSEDLTERRAGEFTERALFHVAATRAINQLFVSWFARPSPFLASGGSGFTG